MHHAEQMSQSLGNPQHRQSRRTDGRKISYIVLEGELCLSLIITARGRDLKIKHHISNIDTYAARILHVDFMSQFMCLLYVIWINTMSLFYKTSNKSNLFFDCHSPACFS